MTLPSLWLVMPAFFLIGITVGLIRSRAALISGLALSAAPLLADMIRLAVDISRDPTSHNLFPLELVAIGVLCLVPASGVVLGHVARRFFSVPRYFVWIAAGSAALVLMLSPVLSRALERNSNDAALETVKRIWQAEKTYAASDAQHRFTCEGPLLPGFGRERWFAQTALGLTAKDRMQGSGGYWFSIRCGKLSRGDGLYITADAGPGRPMYCTDASGVIKAGCGR